MVDTDKCLYSDEYLRGLTDAWNAAKKIVTTRGIPADDVATLFDDETDYDYIFNNYTAANAIERIKAYEEVKIGDEVEIGGYKAVVYAIKEGFAFYFYPNLVYNAIGHDRLDHIKKTGRSFPEYAEALKKMRENQSGEVDTD